MWCRSVLHCFSASTLIATADSPRGRFRDCLRNKSQGLDRSRTCSSPATLPAGRRTHPDCNGGSHRAAGGWSIQVALQTNFNLRCLTEPCRIHNRPRLPAAHVSPSEPMAALTINRSRNTSRALRISCVTEQTLVADAPAEIHVVRPVVPWIHSPDNFGPLSPPEFL